MFQINIVLCARRHLKSPSCLSALTLAHYRAKFWLLSSCNWNALKTPLWVRCQDQLSKADKKEVKYHIICNFIDVLSSPWRWHFILAILLLYLSSWDKSNSLRYLLINKGCRNLPKYYFFCTACGNWGVSLWAFLEDLGILVSVMRRDIIKPCWNKLFKQNEKSNLFVYLLIPCLTFQLSGLCKVAL